MTNRIADIPLRKAAIVAGFAYLIIFLLAGSAEFFIRMQLIVPGDAATTANNILDSEGLFKIGIALDLIVQALIEPVMILALYVLLKPVNKSLSLLAAFFRLAMAAILGINLLNLVFAMQLLSGGDYLTVFETDQLDALVLLFLNAHSHGTDIALVFFSFHLFVLGYLVFKSGYIPRILGVGVMFSALGYLLDSFAHLLLSNSETILSLTEGFVILTFLVGETPFFLWLILKGAKIPEMKNQDETPA